MRWLDLKLSFGKLRIFEVIGFGFGGCSEISRYLIGLLSLVSPGSDTDTPIRGGCRCVGMTGDSEVSVRRVGVSVGGVLYVIGNHLFGYYLISILGEFVAFFSSAEIAFFFAFG